MEKKIIIVSCILVLIFGSCKKDETENVSRIMYYPEITLNSSEVELLLVNTPYVEKSASAIVNGETTPVTITGGVDVTTPGKYQINYSATNDVGYSSIKIKTIFVLENLPIISESAKVHDLSGSYIRTNGVEVTITKLQEGIYYINNVGGVNPVTNPDWSFPFLFFNYEDYQVSTPEQVNPLGGTVYCKEITFSATEFSWVVIGDGFTEISRTFIKQ